MTLKIKTILMTRDGMSEKDAEDRIHECRNDLLERIGNGEDCFDFCEEELGLEPDYLEELIF